MSKSNLLSKKSKSLTSKNKVKPGFYVARCDSVKTDDNYADTVVLIKYTFVNKNGVEFPFSERFVEKHGYERTYAFYEYLDDNNIPEVEDLVGKYEKVRIAWNFSKSGNRLPTITEREFITATEFETKSVLNDAEAVSGQ